MKKISLILLLVPLFLGAPGFGQQPPQRNSIRVVDTLTKQERANRNPVILKAELDSMIQQYQATHQELVPVQPVREIVEEVPVWISIAGIAALLIIAFLLYLLFGYHRRLTKAVGDLKRLIQHFDFYAATGDNREKGGGGKSAMERRIQKLSAELEKEREDARTLANEYGLVRQAIADVYKVRNYPMFSRDKTEGEIIIDLMKTEKGIATHEFEKFLKPVIAITDANKNNPARISAEDSAKLLDLLVSLSLYHIEYLYLRVSELSVGGNMVQRIGSNGKGIDPTLLKKLSLEHGSRALALRMSLDKAGIGNLTYPVFDETDLNVY